MSSSLALAAGSATCPACHLTDRPVWWVKEQALCANCCVRACCLVEPLGEVAFGTVSDVERFSTFAAEEAGMQRESGMRIGQAESVEVWDEGTYDAKVAAVEETESTWPGKEGTPRLKFVFRVRSDDGTEYTDVWKYTNASLSKHKNATLRPLIAVLMPEADLDDPAFVLETDELVNERCRVILGIDAEKGRNTIDKVMRPAPRAARPAAERAAAGAPVAVAPRRAAVAVADPQLDEDDAPPF